MVITPSGGVGPYTITPAQTGLAAGSYTFTVKDANNCTITVPVTITQPAAITATTSITNVLCNGARLDRWLLHQAAELDRTRLRQHRLVLLQDLTRLPLRMQIIVRSLFRLRSPSLRRLPQLLLLQTFCVMERQLDRLLSLRLVELDLIRSRQHRLVLLQGLIRSRLRCE